MAGGTIAVGALCALLPLGPAEAAAGQKDGVALADLVRAGWADTAERAATFGAHAPWKTVTYRGYTFRVPRAWAVIDNGRHSHECVRFDQHAVYLGTVRGQQFCPSWLLGTTESILIEPGPEGSVPATVENPVARQITARGPGIAITATFGTKPTVIDRILASARLPQVNAAAAGGGLVSLGTPADETSRLSALSRRSARGRPMPRPPLPMSVASYRGLGFDACAAPSMRTMQAWRRRSPYRAIGIYIGGADRACAQPNLSRAWVRAEAGAGWHFIPMYAGPQAAFGELHAPARQGAATARDAVAQARRLGFGRQTPIYYDMEAFPPRTRKTALRFLSEWTAELHRLGYSSGVYSSSASGIAYLSRRYHRRGFATPDVIYDALWNGRANTKDRNLRAGQWRHERIHQFRGNVAQKFGGRWINIDRNFLDVRLGPVSATSEATSAVTLPDGSVDLFYRAHGDQVWFDRYRPASGWSKPTRASGQASSDPSVVFTGSSVHVLYRGLRGYLWDDSYGAGGTLRATRRLAMMGLVGSAPRAVSQPGGMIDVFWRGKADDHLWHGQYLPGAGWNGPRGLGGHLRSDPSAVVSSPGTTTVLWKGRDASLWCVTRGLLGRWSAPRSLGMGPLGGQPLATAQPSGGIQVYWHGSGNSSVWEAFYQRSTGWLGPRNLGGHVQRPMQLRHSWLGSAPFAAVGSPGAERRIFWRGQHGRLWTAALSRGRWTVPARIGG